MKRDQRLRTEADTNPGQHPSAKHIMTAEPDHGRDGNRGQNFNDRIIDGVRHDCVFEGVHVLGIHFGKRVEGLPLAVEELQDHHAADVLLQVGIDAGNRNANPAIGIAHLIAKHLRSERNEGQHCKSNERQFPVDAKHDGQNSSQHKNVLENGNDTRGEHFVQSIHIASYPGDQPSHGVFVVKANVHALQVAENFAAQIEHHHLPGPLHEIGLQVFEQEAERNQTNINRANLRNSGERTRTQPPRQQRRRLVCRGQVAVNRHHGEERPQHIRAGLEHD